MIEDEISSVSNAITSYNTNLLPISIPSICNTSSQFNDTFHWTYSNNQSNDFGTATSHYQLPVVSTTNLQKSSQRQQSPKEEAIAKLADYLKESTNCELPIFSFASNTADTVSKEERQQFSNGITSSNNIFSETLNVTSYFFSELSNNQPAPFASRNALQQSGATSSTSPKLQHSDSFDTCSVSSESSYLSNLSKDTSPYCHIELEDSQDAFMADSCGEQDHTTYAICTDLQDLYEC